MLRWTQYVGLVDGHSTRCLRKWIYIFKAKSVEKIRFWINTFLLDKNIGPSYSNLRMPLFVWKCFFVVACPTINLSLGNGGPKHSPARYNKESWDKQDLTILFSFRKTWMHHQKCDRNKLHSCLFQGCIYQV